MFMHSLERKSILSPIHVLRYSYVARTSNEEFAVIDIHSFVFARNVANYYPFFSFFAEDVVKDIRVSCNSDDMTVTFYTTEVEFNGLVYPKGLSKNSSCMTEYIKHQSAVTYVIPLR